MALHTKTATIPTTQQAEMSPSDLTERGRWRLVLGARRSPHLIAVAVRGLDGRVVGAVPMRVAQPVGRVGALLNNTSIRSSPSDERANAMIINHFSRLDHETVRVRLLVTLRTLGQPWTDSTSAWYWQCSGSLAYVTTGSSLFAQTTSIVNVRWACPHPHMTQAVKSRVPAPNALTSPDRDRTHPVGADVLGRDLLDGDALGRVGLLEQRPHVLIQLGLILADHIALTSTARRTAPSGDKND